MDKAWYYPQDPIQKDTSKIRELIARQTEEYLSKGGEIHQYDHTANHSYKLPVKFTKAERIKLQKKHRLNTRHVY